MTNFIVRRTPVTWVAMASSGPADPAYKRPGTGRLEKAVLAGIGLAGVARIARDPRTYERVLLVAIVLAAAVGATHAGANRSVTRLIAWDKQRDLPKKLRGKAKRSRQVASPSLPRTR